MDRCKIVLDKDTGKSRGFAFVEMADGDGSRAIKALNGFEFGGRELVVKIATPKT